MHIFLASTVETKSVFVEGDEVVQQKESYNPETKELTISVPAHGDRVAVTVIIGEDVMTKVDNQYCMVGDTPNNTSSSPSSEEPSEEPNELTELNTDKAFSFDIDEEKCLMKKKVLCQKQFKALAKQSLYEKQVVLLLMRKLFKRKGFLSCLIVEWGLSL